MKFPGKTKIWWHSKGQKRLLLIAHIFVPVLFVFLLLPGPRNLFDDPYSTVLYAADGQLLGARIAEDGQWRFPVADELPHNYIEAVILFEDRYFNYHPGVNPLAIIRAFGQNIQARRTVSGGSTITMQLIRLSRKGKARTIFEKMYEAIAAFRLSLAANKQDVMRLYAAHAPFGGNVVGLEAAAWRYFGRPPHDLSWAEAAVMAVLPNAPSLINPGKNRQLLLDKRNRLLEKLLQNNKLDSLTYLLAIAEPLPGKPNPLPDLAPHYLEALRNKGLSEASKTSINHRWQKQTLELMRRHQQQLAANKVFHSAVLIRDLNTGEVVVYQGNIPCDFDPSGGCYNDMVKTLRSSGSILKPFLYAALVQEGLLQPKALVADIPLWIGGFSPRNFDESYRGAIAADQALINSLNIPFVLMLRTYGIEKFLDLLSQFGFSSFNKSASHYGLSLILGGGEVNLFELTEAYRRLALPLLPKFETNEFAIDAGASWLTLNTLRELNRPETETGWAYFGSSVDMAWKTGTSYGLRDAWAVGITANHVIGVWVGNADGTGRPGLTGVAAAAPLLFELAQMTANRDSWFQMPYDKLAYHTVCSQSGHLASMDCPETVSNLGHPNGQASMVCPYHKIVRLNEDQTRQIPGNCFPDEAFVMKSWFVLPPVMESFYQRIHHSYKALPPVAEGCEEGQGAPMAFVYPPPGTKIYLPIGLSGVQNQIVAEIVHQNKDAILFWHLNGKYIGTTTDTRHNFVLSPEAGIHELVITDLEGQSVSRRFEVVNSNRKNDE
jgi:penicillin-binding protein 1C